jgi:hypothetical protein
MPNIAGTFTHNGAANHAYSRLVEAGFKPDKISLLVSQEGRDRIFTGATTTEQGAHDARKGGVAGAIGVGALGVLVGGLTALLAGPVSFFAAGPLLIALSSGGAGAVIGGLSGALVEAGFSKDDAGEYEKELKAGKAVLVLHDVDTDRVATARAILAAEGAAPQYAA